MARKSKQLSLIPSQSQSRLKSFGGDFNQGKRQTARPISTQRPMHVVIKSTKAVGRLSFSIHQRHLDQSLRKTSMKWGVQIRKAAWVRNHVHLILQFGSRTQYQGWIREFTAAIVHVLKARNQKYSDLINQLTQFFDHRPFSRIVEWGKDFKNALEYLTLNQLEAFGLRPSRKDKTSRISMRDGSKKLSPLTSKQFSRQ